ncbi:MAG TPA: hypothetical protein VGA69_11275 [Nitriliruptorales bacterium]
MKQRAAPGASWHPGRRARVAPLVLVLALGLGLGLGACAGNGDPPGGTGQVRAGDDPTATDAPVGSDPSVREDPASVPGLAGAPTPDGDAVPDGDDAGASPANAGDEPARAQAPAGAIGVAPGTYDYDVEASGRFGAFPPRESTYTLTSVVEPIDADGHQRTVTTPAADDDEPDRRSEQTVAHSQTEVHLIHLDTPDRQGDKGGAEFRPDPPVLLVATTAVPGDRWSWSMTSTDGRIEVRATVEVTGVQTVNVGGTDVDTLVIRSVLDFQGDGFEGVEESTAWFAPERRLTVRRESTMTGTGSFNDQSFEFEADEDRVLRSLEPR